MPIYLYRIIREDGSEGEIFECVHSMSETLALHPETGEKVKRVYSTPNLGIKHTPGHTKSLLSNENLDRKGFTKYERDKVTGKYNKVAGQGPSVLNRPPVG
jgi:hypothetical protein